MVRKIMQERGYNLTRAVETHAAEAKLSVRTVWSAVTQEDRDRWAKEADDALEAGDPDEDICSN